MSNDHHRRKTCIDNLGNCLQELQHLTDSFPIDDVLDDARLQGLPTEGLQRMANAAWVLANEGPETLWAYAERAGLGCPRREGVDR